VRHRAQARDISEQLGNGVGLLRALHGAHLDTQLAHAVGLGRHLGGSGCRLGRSRSGRSSRCRAGRRRAGADPPAANAAMRRTKSPSFRRGPFAARLGGAQANCVRRPPTPAKRPPWRRSAASSWRRSRSSKRLHLVRRAQPRPQNPNVAAPPFTECAHRKMPFELLVVGGFGFRLSSICSIWSRFSRPPQKKIW